MIPEFLKILDIEKRIFVLKYTTQKYRNSEKYSNVIPQTVWHSTRWCCIWWPCPALGYLASPGHSKPSPISPGGSTVHLHSAKTSHRYQRQENNLHVLKINKTLLHRFIKKNYWYTCIYNYCTLYSLHNGNFTALA